MHNVFSHPYFYSSKYPAFLFVLNYSQKILGEWREKRQNRFWYSAYCVFPLWWKFVGNWIRYSIRNGDETSYRELHTGENVSVFKYISFIHTFHNFILKMKTSDEFHNMRYCLFARNSLKNSSTFNTINNDYLSKKNFKSGGKINTKLINFN